MTSKRSNPEFGEDRASPVVLALSAAEAARALSISVRSFRRLVAAGVLPEGLRLGGRRCWSVVSLEGVIASLEAVASKEMP